MVAMIKNTGLAHGVFEKVEDMKKPNEAITELNLSAIKAMCKIGYENFLAVGPWNKIAPNGVAYVQKAKRWDIDLVKENVKTSFAQRSAITGDQGVGAISSAVFVSSLNHTGIQMEELDTVGYQEFPPKQDNMSWFLHFTLAFHLFNDNGGGVAGDVRATNVTDPLAMIRVFTADTIRGAPKDNWYFPLYYAEALTNNGNEDIYFSVDVDVPIFNVTGSTKITEWVHLDYAFGGVDTAGASGLTASAGDLNVSNLGLRGYVKESEVSYQNITYRDESGMRAINKDDTFVDYFGKLVDEDDQEDPNFSVEALYRERIGSAGIVLSQMISALRAYSTLHHKTGDHIDEKYKRLGVSTGVADLVGVSNYLDKTKAPFGVDLVTSVTDKDAIALLFSTLEQDLEIMCQYIEVDKNLLKSVVNAMSFTTSSNVSV
jgi:hypothetical protein